MVNKVSVSRLVNASPERVWQAWTDPDRLKHWFTAEDGVPTEVIEFDVKPDGKVRLKFPGAHGEYTWTWLKIDRPNQLVFDILDFSLPQFAGKGAGGICSVDFKDLGDKTEVTVSGELPDEMSDEVMRDMAIKGWSGTLAKLNKYLSNKKG